MGVLAVTDATFDQEVLKGQGTPVLVDFWAEWCGPCRMLAPVVEGLSATFAGKLKVMKVDTDANTATAQKYQIAGIPCCILFKNGAEIKRFVGFRAQAAFEAEITPFLG